MDKFPPEQEPNPEGRDWQDMPEPILEADLEAAAAEVESRAQSFRNEVCRLAAQPSSNPSVRYDLQNGETIEASYNKLCRHESKIIWTAAPYDVTCNDGIERRVTCRRHYVYEPENPPLLNPQNAEEHDIFMVAGIVGPLEKLLVFTVVDILVKLPNSIDYALEPRWEHLQQLQSEIADAALTRANMTRS